MKLYCVVGDEQQEARIIDRGFKDSDQQFATVMDGNLTLICPLLGDRPSEDEHEIIRTPHEQVSATTRREMLYALIQKLGVPEKWIM